MQSRTLPRVLAQPPCLRVLLPLAVLLEWLALVHPPHQVVNLPQLTWLLDLNLRVGRRVPGSTSLAPRKNKV